MSRWRTPLRWALRVSVALLFLGIVVGCWAYVHFIVVHPGAHLERASILQVISQESPVFYRDGATPLGVFFAEEHRKYVRYDEIPRDFVEGLIAAEDQNFWEHGGFSVRGIGRAFVSNLKAGRVVEGGSTLTQQTAKNLFKRRGRTYREKVRELANALRLERQYEKEDILEFYSNQFYVNGNGRGLAIAARFFFDKELNELELVECAFLAGVVKSPNRYNPWVSGVERQQKARAEARGRVDYVLGRMFQDGALDAERYQAALKSSLNFERGHFRFARSVALDEVERELTRPSFQLLLARHGIGDIGTAGLRITTTLDPVIQRGARYALRHHLSLVGTLLESPEIDRFFGDPVPLKPVDPDQVARGFFHRGTVLSIDPEKRTVRVDIGGVQGTVDVSGNTRLTEAMKRSRAKNNWARASRREVSAFVESLKEQLGRSALVSIRQMSADGTPILDWEMNARVQGAVLVLEQGSVRAMVGGALDSDFNRATVAKRQFGSIWKPVLFQAALHLRWLPTDRLDNRRAVFPYQGGFYYPRPDHKDAPSHVSMTWATAKSENLASIWLLHHLTDKLSLQEFAQIATQVDLMPRSDESAREFRARIHKAGLVPTEPKLNEGLFDRAREDVSIDLAFDGLKEEVDALEALYYGLGFAAQREKVSGNKRLSSSEKEVRSAVLMNSFLRQEALAGRFSEARSRLRESVLAGDPLSLEQVQGLSIRRRDDLSGGVEFSFGDEVPEDFVLLNIEALESLLPSPSLVDSASIEGGLDPLAAAEEGRSVEPAATEPRLKSTSAASSENEVSETAEEDKTEPLRVRPPRDLAQGAALKRRSRRVAAEGQQEGSDSSADPGSAGAEEGPTPISVAAQRAAVLDRLLSPEKVRLEGRLRPSTVDLLRRKMGERRSVLGEEPSLYAPDSLALVRDYRTLVGIRYVIELARRSGVRSELSPVQSLALGSSDVTLLEAAQLYQVMMSGSTYQFFPGAEGALALGQDRTVDEGTLDPPFDVRRTSSLPRSQLIARIERADGELIYEAVRDVLPVQGPETSAAMGTMLSQVVRHGTGTRAAGVVKPTSLDPRRQERLDAVRATVPLAGKTGTTNAYRNAAFVGMVPAVPAEGEDLSWGSGHVVATYVGYDDNTEMKRGGIRIHGSSGGLPVWINVARACVEAAGTGDRVDLVDLALTGASELPLRFPDNFEEVVVDVATGLPMDLTREESEGAEGTTRMLLPSGPGSFSPFEPLPHRAQ